MRPSLLGFSAAAAVAAFFNILPHIQTRGAHNRDGFEIIGFPFTFRRVGGFSGISEFHVVALVADVALGLAFAIVAAYVWSAARHPQATSILTRKNWRPICKRFTEAFLVACFFGVLVFFATGFFREERHGIVLLSGAGFLWCVYAGFALRRAALLDIFAVGAGFAWGFLTYLSAAISIQNRRVSINWPNMIPGLLIIPFAVAITVLPFWFLGRRRRRIGV